MSRLLVKLRYNGSAYVGWQVQKNGLSIQQSVQDALQKVYGKRFDVTGCSRTDSGVHANGYCFCFEPDFEVEPYRVPLSLNSALPEDIAAYDCVKVDDDFHPRYSALGKEYVYKLYDGRHRNPFCEGLSYHYIGKLDVDLMNKAAEYIEGKHDFRCFMANGSKIIDTVRTVWSCKVVREGDNVSVVISGDGFLYKMVRIIVGTLISVSEGKIKPEYVRDIIESRDRSKAGRTAVPVGLYLNRVFYDREEVNEIAREL